MGFTDEWLYSTYRHTRRTFLSHLSASEIKNPALGGAKGTSPDLLNLIWVCISFYHPTHPHLFHSTFSHLFHPTLHNLFHPTCSQSLSFNSCTIRLVPRIIYRSEGVSFRNTSCPLIQILGSRSKVERRVRPRRVTQPRGWLALKRV